MCIAFAICYLPNALMNPKLYPIPNISYRFDDERYCETRSFVHYTLSNNLVSKSIQYRQLALILPIVVQCKCSRYIPNLCLIEQIFKASLINLGFLCNTYLTLLCGYTLMMLYTHPASQHVQFAV